MSDFEVIPSKAGNQSSAMEQVSKSMCSLSTRISAIKGELDSVFSGTVPAVSRISDRILTEAAGMHSLADAVLYIMETYLDAEGKIAAGDVSAAGMGISDTYKGTADQLSGDIQKKYDELKESLRRLLVTIGLSEAKEQTRVKGEEVTAWQEKEQDLYMRRKIMKLKRDERFSKDTWDKASIEERKDILREFIKEICLIMGLPVPQVSFGSASPDANGYVTVGYYNNRDRVWFNTWMLDDNNANGYLLDSSYGLLTTAAHELRHYYQRYTIDHPEEYVVTQDTLNEWSQSFDEYRNTEEFIASGLSPDEAFKAYQDQAVERDARWFSGEQSSK